MRKICYFGCDHISSSYTRHHIFHIVVFFLYKGLENHSIRLLPNQYYFNSYIYIAL